MFIFLFFPGTHYLLLQIIITDLISLSQVKWDVFYVMHRSWLDPIEWCPIYLGIEIFTGTALVFFIIALNFHSISTYNLTRQTIQNEEQIFENDAENSFHDDDEFDDSDSFCDSFVSISPDMANSPRSVTIDYRTTKNTIRTKQPITLIWLLAISICVPLFMFGRIMPNLNRNSDERMCNLFDPNNNFLIQMLLLKMRIILPTKVH